MRFQAKFRQFHQPSLMGTLYKGGIGSRDTDCHEFIVTDAEHEKEKFTARTVVHLVAGTYSESKMYGPASSLFNQGIMYACDYSSCKISCPCRLCRKLNYFCQKAKENEVCQDCSNCKKDIDDHFMYHLAPHLSCKFCENISKHIPHLNLTAPQTWGHWPEVWEVRVPASLFEHKHGYIEPNKDSSFKYPCDKSFSNKGDLKRHEITKHYGVQFKCTQCVCNIPEKTILCTTLDGFMRL